MPVIRPLLFSQLLLIAGEAPALAQVPVKSATVAVRSGQTAVKVTKSSPRTLKAIRHIRSRLTTQGLVTAAQMQEDFAKQHTLRKQGNTLVLTTLTAAINPAPRVFTPQMSPEAAADMAAQSHTPEQLREIAKQQELLLEKINNGYFLTRYNITPKQLFYPYEQALLRAQAEGNEPMLSLLKQCKGLTGSLLYDEIPAKQFGLTNPDEGINILADLYRYIKDTTLMMYLGYSWGKKPLQEVIVPANYHSAKFNRNLDEFRVNHNLVFAQ